MIDLRPRFFGGVCALLGLAALGACSGGDLALPQPTLSVQLAVVSGNQQTGTVGERLPKPFVVEVRDADGQAMTGRRVAFVLTGGPAPGTVAPDTAVTDADGQAVGEWVLGTMPGVYSAEARLVPVPELPEPLTAQLTAAAKAAPPDTVRALSRLSQSGRTGDAVSDPPAVRVVDRYGNPVGGVSVWWSVISGGGKVSSPMTVTAEDGHATVTWTVGNRTGVHQMTASVNGNVTGSPVVFTALVLF